MTKAIGLDVGGVNTKLTFVRTEGGMVKVLKTTTEYFPIWKRGKQHLLTVLKKLRKRTVDSVDLNCVGVTLTAELSDVYQTKSEGVNHVLDSVMNVFVGLPIFVLDTKASLKSVDEARLNPLKVAAANWAATGWMVSQVIRNCIVIDVGSTTTSIIPIFDGNIVADGKTDIEKLQNGELIYTGALRSNIATIVHFIPMKGVATRVSSELFAQSGDVHLMLGNIKMEDYTVETTDGRGKTKIEAMARLARVVCADIEMLNEQEIMDIARHIYDKQVEQIVSGLKQVSDRTKRCFNRETPIVVTGLGREFLAKSAARRTGFNRIINLGDILGVDVALISPSVGVALIAASKLEGRNIKWRQL